MEWLEMDNENSTTKGTGGNGSHASQTVMARCSLCGHPFVRSESRTFPFCSSRCQQIDLGQWLDEKLGLPIECQEDQEFTGFDSDQPD